MTTKSRHYLFGATVRAAAEPAKQARKEADKLACEAWNKRMLGFKVLHSPLRRWKMRSMRATTTSKSDVSVVTRTRRSHCPSFGDPRPHRFTNLRDTCGVKIARRFAAAHTSAVTWLLCGPPRFQRAIHHQLSGRANAERYMPSTFVNKDQATKWTSPVLESFSIYLWSASCLPNPLP